MPAEEAADQVAAVINAAVLGASPSLWSLAGVLHRLRSALGGGRQVAPAEQRQGQQAVAAVRVPPTWFLAGGGARLFFLSGLAQKLVGWPINGILAKKFKLDASL